MVPSDPPCPAVQIIHCELALSSVDVDEAPAAMRRKLQGKHMDGDIPGSSLSMKTSTPCDPEVLEHALG